MIVGIDLGTTNSLIAYYQNGKSTLIPNALGKVMTPSVVSLDDDGQILVGQVAKERLISHPLATVASFKRFMGSQKTHQLVCGNHRQSFSSEELSALVLKSLKQDAETALGQSISDVVISVPAYFNDHQREATKAAAVLAGLNVIRLINEPTAGAMAYGLHHHHSDDGKFLVLDLGGGTFDVTLLELFAGIMEVKASAGDNFLGGEDFTQVLIDGFIAHQCQTHRLEGAFWQPYLPQLHNLAELAKLELSLKEQTTMSLTIDGQTFVWAVDEPMLATLCEPLLERLSLPIQRAVKDAGIKVRELDAIVLVGGASRMPLFRKTVVRLLGRFPAVAINPDETIAIGTSIQAGLAMQDGALDELVLTDVTPYSLGVETSILLDNHNRKTGIFSPIIERNSVIPTSKVETFYAVHNEQTEVCFGIYQGEARLVQDNIKLGEITIPIPKSYKNKATEVPIHVRFSYDVNGLLEVDIDLDGDGETYNLTIENGAKRLTAQELSDAKAKLSALKIHPRDTLANRTLLARAERLYAQSLKAERSELNRLISHFEMILDSQDLEKIRHESLKFAQILDRIENRSDW